MTTEAKTPDPDGFAVSPEPSQPSATPSGGCGGTPPDKPRSGYARQKLRHQRLYAELDELKLENAQLRQDISVLEEMFAELKQLNETLASDLRQARQRPSYPHLPMF